MTNECSICAGTSNMPIYKGILKCQNCGHMFSNLEVDVQEFPKLYGKSYFFGGEYSNYLADKKALQKNFSLRLKVLKQFLKPMRHKRLLEIGCAYGFFLDIAKGQFDTAQGIDINEDGVRYAKDCLKLDVINSDFLEHDFGEQRFDVVCMWDTIEHLPRPQLYLEKIKRHTESGSLLAITTGDIESFNARIRKDKWRLIHPPTHMHYFSKKTLARILENYGFEIIYNHYCGFYRSADMSLYRMLGIKKRYAWLYNLLNKSRLSAFDFYLNLYDIIYAIARKR